jgi:hypothetical protein
MSPAPSSVIDARAHNIQVGDWIRFMRGGAVVISAVLYLVPRAPWDSTPEAMTEIGQVSFKDVLEVRK